MRKYKVTVNGQSYLVEVEEIAEKTASHEPAGSQAAPAETAAETPPKIDLPDESGAFQIVAPMPGSIIEIKIKEGEVVAAGAVLLTLEAMKMENEITSAHAGTVSKVLVREGDAVNTGDPLVLLVRS